MKNTHLLSFFAASMLAGPAFGAYDLISPDMLTTVGELEVTVWAQSPMILNPTNLDVDKDGRIWANEGVNYRGHYSRQPEGDKVIVMEDTDKDGKADKSWTFVQDKALHAPMGIAVLDNKIVVSMAPDMIVYTDVNRNLKFDPGIDTREVLLTGFVGHSHDHSLHSVTFGPDGRWYWNAGNCGGMFTDKSGKTFRIGSAYKPSNVGGMPLIYDPTELAGQVSDDGFVYVGGFAARMNPDGTGVGIIGYNFRNSYEQTVTSFGDVFQNDNDDPPAARTAFLMEYGNAGFNSFDGKRSWGADRRPGQDTPTAEWRQEDPGTMPSGDVYGAGAPTGIAFYENGALGKQYVGTLLSCEPARNTVFGYNPEAQGAGFKLDRFNFLTANKEGKFAGADSGGPVSNDKKTFFRPSDVVVGVDGAIYVTDWFDPRVGGHSDQDETMSGAIYRIAPKGFKSVIPKFDLNTTEGQITALESPAVNVRSLGFTKLKEQGEKAVPAVSKLLDSDNQYFRARAVWLLSQLGPKGMAQVESLLKSNKDDRIRTVAYRAIRKENHNFQEWSEALSKDPSPAVRREVALAMRNETFANSANILSNIAARYDGEDRWMLEAIGTGSAKKEAEVYAAISKKLGNSDSLKWSPSFANLAWRLHPEAATDRFKVRALSGTLPIEARKAALVALAYVGTKPAAYAILDAAQNTGGPVQAEAMWWLLNRKDSLWAEYGLNAELKSRGLYDPEKVEITEFLVPEAPASVLTVEQVAKLNGDAERGKLLITACYTCHKVGATGVEYGPDLTSFAKMQPTDVVIRSIITPSADISSGFTGYEVKTKDGKTIHGLLLSGGDPTIVASQGGVVQLIPRNKVESRNELNRSLMLSAEQLGFGPQEVADVVAYLKSIK